MFAALKKRGKKAHPPTRLFHFNWAEIIIHYFIFFAFKEFIAETLSYNNNTEEHENVHQCRLSAEMRLQGCVKVLK